MCYILLSVFPPLGMPSLQIVSAAQLLNPWSICSFHAHLLNQCWPGCLLCCFVAPRSPRLCSVGMSCLASIVTSYAVFCGFLSTFSVSASIFCGLPVMTSGSATLPPVLWWCSTMSRSGFALTFLCFSSAFVRHVAAGTSSVSGVPVALWPL